MFKFIHAADIHLDSHLRGIARYEGAPVEEIRGATRKALRNLTDLALEEGAAFVLVAGDLYDGDWKDYSTGLFFHHELTRLKAQKIPVFLVHGNHDAQSLISRALRLPDNVTVFSAATAETRTIEELQVAIHGRSFARREVEEDLSASYPPPRAGYFNIGLLHTAAEGREGHETYAPCCVEALAAKGYDYWALGHVHRREVLKENPWIVFPGNLQGRHIRETGPKGCTLVSVEDGTVRKVEHRAVDVLRWALVRVEVSSCESASDVLAALENAVQEELERAEGRPAALRIELCGASKAHGLLASRREHWTQEARAAALAASGGQAWVEKILWRTRPPEGALESVEGDEALGGILRAFEALGRDAAALTALLDDGEIHRLSEKLPPELRDGEEALDLASPEVREALLRGARDLLFSRLLAAAGAGEAPP